jgi:hypothetical protein
MLLDMNQNLKLSDFDRGIKTREDIAMLTKSYRRLLDAEKDGGADTYGTVDA